MVGNSQRKNIFKLQNEDKRLLKCLAAQRRSYSDAKNIMTAKRVLLLLLVVSTITAYVCNNGWLSAVASFIAVFFMFISKHMDISIAKHKNEAALLQQIFDVTLFSQALGTSEEEWGMNYNHLSVYNLINSVSENFYDVRNWYQDYSAHPAPKQVFYCQNENIKWEDRLRNDYIAMLRIICAVMGTVALIGVITLDPTFSKVVCGISWFIPAIDYALSVCSNINNDLTRLTRINELCAIIDDKLRSSAYADIKNDLIRLQERIFEHRMLAYTIPDCFYCLKRGKYHFTAKHTAEDISCNA